MKEWRKEWRKEWMKQRMKQWMDETCMPKRSILCRDHSATTKTHKNDKKLCLKIHLRNQWSPMPSSFETLHLGKDAPSPLYLQNNKVCKRCKIILLFGHSKIQTDSNIWPRGINQECLNERLSRQEGRTENGQTEGVKECRNCRECIEMAYHGPALLWMRLTWTPSTDAMWCSSWMQPWWPSLPPWLKSDRFLLYLWCLGWPVVLLFFFGGWLNQTWHCRSFSPRAINVVLMKEWMKE